MPKPPGKSSPSFNQADEAAAKELLNLAPFIIKHRRGGAVSMGAVCLSFTSNVARKSDLDKTTCPIENVLFSQ